MVKCAKQKKKAVKREGKRLDTASIVRDGRDGVNRELSCSPFTLFAKVFSAGGLTLGISLLNAVRPSGDNAV
jgi:hypothetical protein